MQYDDCVAHRPGRRATAVHRLPAEPRDRRPAAAVDDGRGPADAAARRQARPPGAAHGLHRLAARYREP